MSGALAVPLLVSATALAGVAIVLVLGRPTEMRTAPPALPARVAVRAVAAVASGSIVVALTGWPLVALVVAATTAWGSGWALPARPRTATRVEVADAIVSWVENLRDVMLAGEQPVGAIRATVDTADPAIRRPVRALAARLGRQPAETVLRRFADELDDPVGDLVATGLLIAITRGARTVPVLSALAEQARHQADRRRLVEVERAPVTREVLIVTSVMAALLVGLLVFARSAYLDAYDAAGGQLFLASMLSGYAAMLAWVRRLVRMRPPARFLSVGGTGQAEWVTR